MTQPMSAAAHGSLGFRTLPALPAVQLGRRLKLRWAASQAVDPFDRNLTWASTRLKRGVGRQAVNGSGAKRGRPDRGLERARGHVRRRPTAEVLVIGRTFS